MILLGYGIIVGISWLVAVWSMHHAPTDVELWDEEIE